VGLTVSSFSSVSLSPPLVLWCLSHKASSLAAFEQCEHYAIHVLRAEQAEWARLFARRGADRFAQVGTRPGLGQVPLLSDTLATFECRNRSRHAEGDHTIFVGEVLRWSHHTHGAPLLHHRGTLLAPQAEAVHAGG
jgi:flavin reductase (DIM6/NTAB) family NADH-FMN oxidoreductase RutF